MRRLSPSRRGQGEVVLDLPVLKPKAGSTTTLSALLRVLDQGLRGRALHRGTANLRSISSHLEAPTPQAVAGFLVPAHAPSTLVAA